MFQNHHWQGLCLLPIAELIPGWNEMFLLYFFPLYLLFLASLLLWKISIYLDLLFRLVKLFFRPTAWMSYPKFFQSIIHSKKKIFLGASLVAQWLRICLPMQGTRVRALVWEDPTCRGATKPVRHNYWACASGACAPQRERPRPWEARAPQWRVAPTCHN